jgi:hypothetical protein
MHDKTLSNLTPDNFQSNALIVLGNNNQEKNYNDSMECLKENDEDMNEDNNNAKNQNIRKPNNNKVIHSDVYIKKLSLAILEKRNSFRDKVPQLFDIAKMNNFFN